MLPFFFLRKNDYSFFFYSVLMQKANISLLFPGWLHVCDQKENGFQLVLFVCPISSISQR